MLQMKGGGMNKTRWVMALAVWINSTLGMPAEADEKVVTLPKPDFESVEIKPTQVADKIYMLEGMGGNIGVCVGADGTFMVDDQFAPLSQKIVDAVREISLKPTKYLLNTHWHSDHTGGNENFGKAGAVIIAHHNVRRMLSEDQVVTAFNMEVPASAPVALPTATFDSGLTLHMNDDTISIYHVPHAHTDGDSFVHFEKANVIHTGDIFFHGFYPFIDKQSGGSIVGTIRAMDRILTLTNSDTKIIPGHGPLGDKAALEKARELLISVQEAITPLLQAGKSEDEIIAQNPLAELDEEFGDGFLTTKDFTHLAIELLRK